MLFLLFFFSSRRRHTRCALVTGVQTCALPISAGEVAQPSRPVFVSARYRQAERHLGIRLLPGDADRLVICPGTISLLACGSIAAAVGGQVPDERSRRQVDDRLANVEPRAEILTARPAARREQQIVVQRAIGI